MKVKFYVVLEPVLLNGEVFDVKVAQTIRKKVPRNGRGVAIPIELQVSRSLFAHPVLQGKVERVGDAVKLMPGALGSEDEDGRGSTD